MPRRERFQLACSLAGIVVSVMNMAQTHRIVVLVGSLIVMVFLLDDVLRRLLPYLTRRIVVFDGEQELPVGYCAGCAEITHRYADFTPHVGTSDMSRSAENKRTVQTARTVEQGVREAIAVLLERARTAREASKVPALPVPQQAAIRGKAMGYMEASELLTAVLAGGKLRQKWHSPASSVLSDSRGLEELRDVVLRADANPAFHAYIDKLAAEISDTPEAGSANGISPEGAKCNCGRLPKISPRCPAHGKRVIPTPDLRSRLTEGDAAFILKAVRRYHAGVRGSRRELHAFIDSLAATPSDLQEALEVGVVESPTPAETPARVFVPREGEPGDPKRWHIEIICDTENEAEYDELMDLVADLAIGFGQDHGWDAHVSAERKDPLWSDPSVPEADASQRHPVKGGDE